MSKRRKLKYGEHRFRGLIIKKTKSQYKKWKVGKKYDRQAKTWISVNEKEIKKLMIEAFKNWGGDKKTIQKKLVRALENGDIRNEGEGDWQIGNTDTPSLKAGSIKLRYNEKQKKLIIYMRDSYKYTQEV